VVTAAARLARRVAAEAPPRPHALAVGRADWRTLAALERVFGSIAVAENPDQAIPARGGYDVAVALDWLHTLDDPDGGLARLRAIAPGHLLLGAPREPLAKLGVTFTTRLLGRTGTGRGTAWSAPGFLRLVSRHGAVRDVAHPLGWSLAWVRRR
jgi:hypothetical protein